MPIRGRSRVPFVLAVCIALVVLAGAGCQRSGQIVLHQPFAPPSQREMTLESRWTYTAREGGRQNCVLAFPLPGAVAGARDFLLYVSAPEATGPLRVEPGNAEAARGFLIQAVGRLAGKCEFVEGSVEFKNVWLQPGLRRIELDVLCRDETRITGSAYVEHLSREVRGFERRYAADIARLDVTSATHATDGQPPADEAAEGEETLPRPGATP